MRKDYVRKRLPRFSAAWWQKFTEYRAETGCVLWAGFVCKQGYARTWFNGKSGILMHRASYELAYGPFDPSLKVCHRCDTPRCVNPEHLFLGTQKDNLQDMFAKGRARPQGKVPKTIRVTAPLASTLTDVKLEKTVEDVNIVHLRCTSAMTAPWCRVLGVPGASDASKIPPERRPRWWTVVRPAESSTVTSQRDSGAEVSSVSSSLRRSESGQ